VRRRARKLLDYWEAIIKEAREHAGRRTYSGFDRVPAPGDPFLHTRIEERLLAPGHPETHFIAPTSLRDVEPTVALWLPDRKAV
jgi:hypothetical protein